MQKIFRILMLMLASALVACGGGGGSSGSNPNQQLLVTTAGAEVILPVGAARNYQINGGVPPYRVGNTNQAIAIGQVSGNTLIIGAVSAGATKVNVLDNSGTSIAIDVKVGSSVPLYTTAPGSLTIGVGASVARTFWIGGGGAPYTVEGGNSNVALVQMLGDTQWRVTGVAIGSTTIKIRDAAGVEVSVALEVGSPELRISPTDLVMPVGLEAVAKISGGQPPYRVAGGIPAAITATIVGDELRIKGNLASELEISVMDAAGQIVKVKVEINTATTSIRLSPSAVSVSENDTQSLQFGIFGAVGATCVFTSDPSFLQPTVPGCATRNSVTLNTGTRGSRCVNGDTVVTLTVVDENRSVGTADVAIVDNGSCGTLTVAPQSLNLGSGASADVLLSGGSGKFDYAVSNSAVATAVLAGNKLTVKAGATTGSATVTVRDQTDATQTVVIPVTVTAGPAPVQPMTASPSAATGSVQETLQFLLQNGMAPYSVVVSNPSIATVTLPVVANLINVKLLQAGQTTLVVTDANGQTLNIEVTANQAQQASLRFAPSAFEIGEDSLQPVTLTVFGGTPPYRAVTSDLTLSGVQVNNNEFTVGLGTNGRRCINPVDSSGKYIPSGSYPVTLTVIDSGGAFATSVMTIRDNGSGMNGPCADGSGLTTTAGPATSVMVGSLRTYSISGGTEPYTVASSNTAVATVALSSQNGFSITGLTAGTATVTIRDAASSTVTITVNVNP